MVFDKLTESYGKIKPKIFGIHTISSRVIQSSYLQHNLLELEVCLTGIAISDVFTNVIVFLDQHLDDLKHLAQLSVLHVLKTNAPEDPEVQQFLNFPYNKKLEKLYGHLWSR